MQIIAASLLDRLVTLTAPGAPVAPVVAALDAVATSLRETRPLLPQGKVSAELLGDYN